MGVYHLWAQCGANILQIFCQARGKYKKYLSLRSAHYTPNFYISFVIELSLDQCPRAWILIQLDWILVTPHTGHPLCLGGHLSRKEPKAKSSRRSFVILPCMLCFASLVSIVSLSNPIHISLYSLFAKGLSLTNVGDLRGNKDLSILITVEHGLIVRK